MIRIENAYIVAVYLEFAAYVGFSAGWIFVKHRQNRLAWAGLSLLFNALLATISIFLMVHLD